MLKLYQGNRTEQLGDLLAVLLREPLASPLEPELIVVPHMGMARWLTLQLAEANGICANTEFMLPAGFVWRILNRLFAPVHEEDPFDKESLKWRIFRLLATGNEDRPRGDTLQNFLTRGDELDRFQLAGRLAECFDQYLVFRPDWIISWQSSRQAVAGDQWQAELWRSIVAEIGKPHWVDLQRRFLAAERAGRLDPGAFPERVTIFGIPSLSPAYLEILDRLSIHTELHCFLLNPCRVHWTDILTPRDESRRELSGGSESLYLEVGNPLLASLGAQGRDLFRQLLQFDPGTIDLFSDPGEGDSLLASLQGDILDLTAGGQRAEAKRTIAAADRSLQIHACHSPMREVEVLKDRLFDLFDRDEELRADDVLVLVTDMEVYAPLIEFVFGEAGEGPTVPFNLSGRGVAAAHPLVDAFLALLTLPGSRFEAETLVTLLEVPAIRRRFGLADGDLGRIVRWVEASGIRWGRDAASRDALGLPATAQNSWRAGIDRLLLGLALPEGEGALFRGVFPCDSAEGSDTALLGGLIRFVETLFDAVDRLQRPRTLHKWSELLSELIEQFLLPEEEEAQQFHWLRELVAGLVDAEEKADCREPVELEVVHDHCVRSLEKRQQDGRLFSGGITFSTLTAMRGVPFRVICLLGLDDGRFPRNPPRSGFDLMARSYRPGDRSLRLDDRYLFLETILSARQVLYLSFVGQDVRDNAPLPPSVLVSELIDYLDAGFEYEEGEPVVRRLPLRHPLQPFSRRYFGGEEGLFSYSQALCRAAETKARARRLSRPFLVEDLEPPGDAWRTITLDQLRRFFQNPTRFLLRERMGISLPRGSALLDNREPFELDRWEHNRILRRLVAATLANQPYDSVVAEERAAGTIPHGTMGERLLDSLQEGAENLCDRLREFELTPPADTVDVEIRFDDLRLTGRLFRPDTNALTGYSVTRRSAAHQLGIWIDHLVLNAVLPGANAVETRWMYDDGLVRFRPATEAKGCLATLVRLYFEGLSRPIHLFPAAAHAFFEKRQAGKPREQCLNAARRQWTGGEFSFGESQEEYRRLAFPDGGTELLDAAFEQLSIQVFEPLFMHREVG